MTKYIPIAAVLSLCLACLVIVHWACQDKWAPDNEITFTFIDNVIIAEPVDEIISLTVRAYCPKKCCCGRWADGITASGKPAVGKFVASSKYPFGTKVYVPGYGEVEVLDRGPNVIEVFFGEHSDALEWGKQELKVRVEAGM